MGEQLRLTLGFDPRLTKACTLLLRCRVPDNRATVRRTMAHLQEEEDHRLVEEEQGMDLLQRDPPEEQMSTYTQNYLSVSLKTKFPGTTAAKRASAGGRK